MSAQFFHKWPLAVSLAFAIPATAESQTFFPVSVDYSNAAIRRDVGALNTAGQLTHRVTEMVIDAWLPSIRERSTRGRALRLAQVYFVSMPIASLTHTVGHEMGHVSYIKDRRLNYDFAITVWPWPVPWTGAETSINELPDLGIIGGGSEAAFVHESAVSDRIYGNRPTHYFDWIQFLYAKADTIVYVISDLRPEYLANERDFYSETHLGDPRRFALEFEKLRQNKPFPSLATIRSRGASLRLRALTSLADLTLISAVLRSLQYVIDGDRLAEPLRIRVGRLDVVPALHFVLTGVGYEHRVSARVMGNGSQLLTYVRSITSPTDDHLRGVGAQWALHGHGVRFIAKADYWRSRVSGVGHRAEVGVQRALAWRALEMGASLGYKTAGFLEGYPWGSTVLVGLSGRVRF